MFLFREVVKRDKSGRESERTVYLGGYYVFIRMSDDEHLVKDYISGGYDGPEEEVDMTDVLGVVEYDHGNVLIVSHKNDCFIMVNGGTTVERLL